MVVAVRAAGGRSPAAGGGSPAVVAPRAGGAVTEYAFISLAGDTATVNLSTLNLGPDPAQQATPRAERHVGLEALMAPGAEGQQRLCQDALRTSNTPGAGCRRAQRREADSMEPI